MESMFERRFNLFEQIKETVSAHLSKLRNQNSRKSGEKIEHLGGCGEEPNIRISPEFIYVEETKQLKQKEVQ